MPVHARGLCVFRSGNVGEDFQLLGEKMLASASRPVHVRCLIVLGRGGSWTRGRTCQPLANL